MAATRSSQTRWLTQGAARIDDAIAERDRRIRRAFADGLLKAPEIAEAVGLTTARVYQIVKSPG